MAGMGHRADFYEDDEDPQAIRAAFERGPHGVTARPSRFGAVQNPGSTFASSPDTQRIRVTGSSGLGAVTSAGR